MYANRLVTLGGTQKSLLQKALDILTKYGTNAHVYLPGVGTINGLQAANYLDYTETIGSEQLQNPTFAAATGWTQGAGWMIASGMATATTASGALTQTALVLGQYDQVQVTTTAASAGNFDVLLGGVKLTTISTVGTFTVRGTAGGTTLSLQGNGYTGVLTLASVKNVLQYSSNFGTVDNAVGNVVDSSSVRSADLILPNGTWTPEGGLVITSQTANSLVIAGAQSTDAYNSNPSAVVGFTYEVTYTISNCTSGGAAVVVGYGAPRVTSSGNGSFTRVFTSSGNNTIYVYFSSFTGTISNISVKQLTGINAFQATAGNRPTLRRGLVNLLTYSKDISNAAWVLQGGASRSGATVTLAATGDKFEHPTTLAAGTLVASAILSGVGTVSLTMYNATDGLIGRTSIVLNGTPTLYKTSAITATIANTLISIGRFDGSDTATSVVFGGAGLFAGNVTPTEIPLTTTAPASSSTGNYFLEFNGTSNYLQMAQPLFQMSDDHAVIAGCKQDSGTSTRTVFTVNNTSTGAVALLLGYTGSNLPSAYWFDDASQLALISASAPGYSIPQVLTALKLGNAKTLRVNSASIGTNNTVMGATTVTLSGIGASAPNANALTGSIYPIIALKNPTLPDVQVLEKFVGMLTGPNGVYF